MTELNMAVVFRGMNHDRFNPGRCSRVGCRAVDVHNHCQGKTTKGKLCNNRQLYSKFCSLHISQAVCFYPLCKNPVICYLDICNTHQDVADIYYELRRIVFVHRFDELSIALLSPTGDLKLLVLIITFLV